VAKREGDAVFLDFTQAGEGRAKSIRLTALDRDHLTIFNPSDFGECRLRRVR
jgi:hypothetical protein